ncbi:MAG: beta-L-arabinofuranosidase domain-containing protein, partial [Christensenellales bacterium]
MTDFFNPDRTTVRITDNFWSKRQKLVSEKTLFYQWDILNDRIEGVPKSHAVENFRIAAGLSKGEHYGYAWQDHDVAKWMEAAAHSLKRYPNRKLEDIL